MEVLVVASRNAHKVAEMRAILDGLYEVRDLSAVSSPPEVAETGATFEENATLKAVAISRVFDGWVLADDSGIEVDALGGAPGVRSARFAGEGATDAANNALLLARLEGVRGRARAARFRCVLVVARAGARAAMFSGTVEGVIAPVARGGGGFGYDPIFIPDGYCRSFAELGAATKNAISHRARALDQLRRWALAGRGGRPHPPVDPPAPRA